MKTETAELESMAGVNLQKRAYRYEVNTDGDLYENGQPCGKLATGNSGACYRLVAQANA